MTRARVTTESPADVGEGQARQPSISTWVDSEPNARRPRRCLDGVVGEHDAAGFARCSTRGDDKGVARLDGFVAVSMHGGLLRHPRANGASSHRRSAFRARRREPEVHGVNGVTVVPCPAQLVDEARATGDRERDQLRHAPEPTGLPC